MQRIVEKAPDSIVENGKLRYGVFDVPIRNLNFTDAKMGWVTRFRFMRAWRLKEWYAYGINSGDWHLTVFMSNSKYLCNVNVYVSNSSTGEEYKAMRGMPGGKVKISKTQYNDNCLLSVKNFHVEIVSKFDERYHEVHVNIAASKKCPAITMELRIDEDYSQQHPLVTCFPLADDNHFIYTHKAPMPVSGRATVGDREIILNPKTDLAVLDEHKSIFPYHTIWRWATFAFRDDTGRVLGINFGDHETARNQDYQSENCLWIGNRIALIGAGTLEFDQNNHMKPWRITEKNGRIDLTFHPVNDKIEKMNFGIVGIDYFQPSGYFTGYIVDDDGTKICVDGAKGVAERMDTRF